MVATANTLVSHPAIDADLVKEILKPERICPSAEKVLQPFEGRTIASLLRHRASVQSEDTAFAHLQGRTETDLHVTYAQLEKRVLVLADHLRQRGAQGKRIVLMYPTGIDFVVSLLACIVSGAVAVPVFELRRSRHVERLRNIWKDASPGFALTTSIALANASTEELDSLVAESGEWLCTDTLSFPADRIVPELHLSDKPNELSLLQYTSGSTGSPKGVMVSESSLLVNSHSLNKWTQPHGQSLQVNWLPPYHDMGLVGGLLQPLFSGYPCVLLSPVSVVQRPKLLLQAISRYRATVSGGPNFIYDFCATRIRDRDLSEVDLSSWEFAFNGAEPINRFTLERFSERFARYGFSPKAHTPCYGMAEATLFVTGARVDQCAIISDFDAAELENGTATEPTSGGREASLVSSGCIVGNGCEVKIVDFEQMTELADGLIGEIWLKGEALSTGYWRKTETNAATFNCTLSSSGNSGFMRTGDLGFVKNDQLFITGRAKDLIVIRGRNLHPQDIERSVAASHSDIKPGTTAAVPTILDGIETLTIIQEWNFRKGNALREIVKKHILAAVSNDHEVTVGDMVFIEPGSLPKTSSGKLQRLEARKLFVTKTYIPSSEKRGAGVNQQIYQRSPQRIVEAFDKSFGAPDDDNALMSYRKVVELDEKEFFQDEFLQHMIGLRLHHYYVPKAYGGTLGSYEELYEIAKLLARRDLATAVTMSTMVWSCAVWIGGDEQQKQRCAELTRSYNGAMCLAYTERAHGTDLFATELLATEVDDGFKLVGEKWPTHRGSRSDVIVLLARTSVDDGPRSLSMFIVEKDSLDRSKMQYLPKIKTHGLRGCDTSGLRFNGAKIPKSALVGEMGKGIDLALKTFQITRTLCVGLSVGAAQCNLRIATEFALERYLYSKSAFQIPNAKFRLAGAFSDILIMDALGICLSRALHILPRQFSVLSAVGKYGAPVYLEETHRDITTVLGARYFFREGHKHGMFQKTLRDSQIVRLFDGSSEVNLSIVANQLPLLMRMQEKAFAEPKTLNNDGLAEIFDIDSNLPDFNGGRLDLNAHGRDSIMESLPSVCADVCAMGQSEKLPADLIELVRSVQKLHEETMVSVLSKGFAPDQPSAFDAAKDYITVHIAVCSLRFWLHNRNKINSFFQRGDWLELGLRRLLRTTGVRVGTGRQETVDLIGDELKYRTQSNLSYSLLPISIAAEPQTSNAATPDTSNLQEEIA